MFPQSKGGGESSGSTKTNVLQKDGERLEARRWCSPQKRINRVGGEVGKKTEGTPGGGAVFVLHPF